MKIQPHFHHSICLSFVTNSPVAEKVLSDSTDLGLTVIKAWDSFSRLVDLFFGASKRLISFFIICDRISSCAGSFVVFTLKDYMDSVL